MTQRRRVALLVEWSRVYGRGVLEGIAAHVRTHGNWNVFHTERRLCDAAPSWLKNWHGDGIIARIESRRLLSRIMDIGLPTVDLFGAHEVPGLGRIHPDERTVARMAAEHLLERGLKHFAYCGLAGILSSELRGRYFVEHLRRAGYGVHVYQNPHHGRTTFISSTEEYELLCEEAVTAWIKSLPKPVGLMACNDVRAHQIVMACGENRIAVPDAVAVIGVDNDQIVCELCQPALSSVELNPQKVGNEAAMLLDRMIDGEKAPSAPTLVEPRGVVARQSTDVVAVADSDVAAALYFIRKQACQGVRVQDVLVQVNLSRSTLERRFANVLGRSVKAEIDRVRLEQVKQLLAMTDHSLAKIAQLTGFSYVEGMCCLFKNTFDQTPGQYRKTSRNIAD